MWEDFIINSVRAELAIESSKPSEAIVHYYEALESARFAGLISYPELYKSLANFIKNIIDEGNLSRHQSNLLKDFHGACLNPEMPYKNSIICADIIDPNSELVRTIASSCYVDREGSIILFVMRNGRRILL